MAVKPSLKTATYYLDLSGSTAESSKIQFMQASKAAVTS
jgi:hypothetical protein